MAIRLRDFFIELPIFILAFISLPRILFMRSDAKYSKLNKDRQLVILANGPSCHETYTGNCDEDIAVVNFFALNELFVSYKPKHYVLMDPLFFGMSNDRHQSLIDEINAIDWSMNLYLPSKYYTIGRDIFHNKNVNIKAIRHNACFSNNKFFFLMYKMNLFTPRFQNVVNAAIYIGANLGYREIFVHGVESNEFINYFVDCNNDVHLKAKHFYGESNINMTEEGRIKKGEFWRYLRYYTYMLESYSHLNLYTKSINCKVLNCTMDSFIDSFEKRKMRRD